VEIAWHFSHISAAHFVQNLIILTELFAAFGALCDSELALESMAYICMYGSICAWYKLQVLLNDKNY